MFFCLSLCLVSLVCFVVGLFFFVVIVGCWFFHSLTDAMHHRSPRFMGSLAPSWVRDVSHPFVGVIPRPSMGV